jgi:hypothetical protein
VIRDPAPVIERDLLVGEMLIDTGWWIDIHERAVHQNMVVSQSDTEICGVNRPQNSLRLPNLLCSQDRTA